MRQRIQLNMSTKPK